VGINKCWCIVSHAPRQDDHAHPQLEEGERGWNQEAGLVMQNHNPISGDPDIQKSRDQGLLRFAVYDFPYRTAALTGGEHFGCQTVEYTVRAIVYWDCTGRGETTSTLLEIEEVDRLLDVFRTLATLYTVTERGLQ